MRAVIVIGLGNIGSHLVSLLARIPGIRYLVLIDPDSYEESNIAGQAIARSAIGVPKVEVQAARVRSITSHIEVHTIQDRIENVPAALLKGALMLTGLDSRLARQWAARLAWRLGVTFIEAAVGEQSLIRVSVVVPGESNSCLECSWDDRVYECMAQVYPCGSRPTTVATAAPAELGAFAGAFIATECRKLLADTPHGTPLSGEQVMIDTSTYAAHRHRVTRNERCRFDHSTWPSIDALPLRPAENTLDDLFDALGTDDPIVRVEQQHSFATRLHCTRCGQGASIGLALLRRIPEAMRTCRCGGRMDAPGFFRTGSIRRIDACAEDLRLGLDKVGFRAGDLLSVTGPGGEIRRFEIGRQSIDG